MSKPHVNRLIQSSDVTDAVTPMGVKPTSERQARPLTQLETPERQAEAWERAVEIAPKDDDGKRRIGAVQCVDVSPNLP